MAIRKVNSTILAEYLTGAVVRAKYQERDFPLIEMTIKVEGALEGKNRRRAKPTDVTEVVLTMTLWEANELLRQFQLQVSNATRLSTPRNAIAVPFQEGDGGL